VSAVFRKEYAQEKDSLAHFRFNSIGIASKSAKVLLPTLRLSAQLGGVQEGGWVVISVFTGVIALIATISALTAHETKGVPTEQLGVATERRREVVAV